MNYLWNKSRAFTVKSYNSDESTSEWQPPGSRDVDCVVTAEDGTWGFGKPTVNAAAQAPGIGDFTIVIGDHDILGNPINELPQD